MPICANTECNATYPATILIEGKRRNLCNRKFCFQCVPFGSRKSSQSALRNVFRVSTAQRVHTTTTLWVV